MPGRTYGVGRRLSALFSIDSPFDNRLCAAQGRMYRPARRAIRARKAWAERDRRARCARVMSAESLLPGRASSRAARARPRAAHGRPAQHAHRQRAGHSPATLPQFRLSTHTVCSRAPKRTMPRALAPRPRTANRHSARICPHRVTCGADPAPQTPASRGAQSRRSRPPRSRRRYSLCA